MSLGPKQEIESIMSLLNLYSYRKLYAIQNTLRQTRRFKSLKISTPPIQKYLSHLVFENEKLLSKSTHSVNEIKKLREMKPVITILTEKFKLQTDINDLDQQRRYEEDEEIKAMIDEEAQTYRRRIQEVDTRIEAALLEPYMTHNGILLELAATEDGETAPLLVKELFNLYKVYADYKDWKFDVVSVEECKLGINKAAIIIEGFGAFEMMNIETGTHHRVSSTDKTRRTHISSLANVSVLPQPNVKEFVIPEEDLVIETKQTRDPRNRDKLLHNSVCVTHTASATSIVCKSSTSNEKNEQLAKKMLQAILFQVSKACDNPGENLKKKTDNPYVRTYDHVLDRVLEHREGDDTVHKLSRFLSEGGLLERLQRSVLHERQYKTLLKDIKKYEKIINEKESVTF